MPGEFNVLECEFIQVFKRVRLVRGNAVHEPRGIHRELCQLNIRRCDTLNILEDSAVAATRSVAIVILLPTYDPWLLGNRRAEFRVPKPKIYEQVSDIGVGFRWAIDELGDAFSCEFSGGWPRRRGGRWRG